MSSQTSKVSNSKTAVTTPSDSQNRVPSVQGVKQERSKSDTETSLKSIKVMSASSERINLSDALLEVGEEFGDQDEYELEEDQQVLDKQQAIRDELASDSEITWAEPDVLSYSSYSSADEEEADDRILLRASTRMRRESTDRIYLKEDVREMWNKKHGYTLVETSVEDTLVKKVIRKFYPRIIRKIKTYKQMVPMKITYNKLTTDESDVVEEEDLVDEEMVVDEITDTILIKEKNEKGEDIEKRSEVVKININDPSKKKKFLKLKMVNDVGQVIEEVVELNDDTKRTNDIFKAAVPYMRKKLKERSAHFADLEDGEPHDRTRSASLSYADWVKSQNSQKTKTLKRAIENLKKALDERKMLNQLNKYLGKKLCEHYDIRGQKDPDFKYNQKDENSDEGKTNYQSVLLEFNDVVNYSFTNNKERERLITSADRNLQKASDDLNELRQTFYDLEESMVRELNPGACDIQTYRSMTHQDVINQQKFMDTNLSKVRFEFIKSQLILKELKDKEADFQQSIDHIEAVDFVNYEAMRAKTKDLNDKLDLKDKHVMAMKDTMTQRVQALAHVRLKKEHLGVENNKLKHETYLITEELKALRTESIKVQQKRRKLEKQLNKILEKEGIEKYPYLAREASVVESKDEDQRRLLSDLAIKCTEMKGVIQQKLEDHKEYVEKYQESKSKRRQETKLFSFDFK